MSDEKNTQEIVIHTPKPVVPKQNAGTLLNAENAAKVMSGAAVALWMGKRAFELARAWRNSGGTIPEIRILNGKNKAKSSDRAIQKHELPGEDDVVLRYTRYESWTVTVRKQSPEE